MSEIPVKKSNQLAQGSLAADTPVIIGNPSNGAYLYTTPALLEAYFKIRQSIANTTSIPFTHTITHIATHTMAGARTITPNATGAQPGNGSLQRIVADGTNTPAFSGFKKSNASKDWVNTNGAVNVVMFLYDGTNYWYSIYQEAAGTVTPTLAAPTLSSASITMGTFTVNSSSHPTGSQNLVWEISTSNTFGATVANGSANAPTASFNFSSGAPSTAYYVRAKFTGTGYDDSAWSTVLTVTTAAADTTAPTLVSAVIQAGIPNIIRLTYNEALPSGAADETKFSVDVDGVNNVVPNVNMGSTIVEVQVTDDIDPGAVVTITYTPGSSGSRIRDVAGNFAAGFTSQAVTNNLTGGADANANAYIAAVEGADGLNASIPSGRKTKIDRFFKDLKGVTNGSYATLNIYSKIRCGWLLQHEDGSGNKFNLTNPANTDGAFRLTFGGSPVSNSAGMNANTSGFADTHFDLSTLPVDSNGVVVAVMTDSTNSGGMDIGAGDFGSDIRFFLHAGFDSGKIPGFASGQNSSQATGSALSAVDGVFVGSRTSNTSNKLYRNKTLLNENTTARTGALPSLSAYLLAINSSGSAAFPSPRTLGLVMYTEGLSAAEVNAVTDAVNALIAP